MLVSPAGVQIAQLVYLLMQACCGCGLLARSSVGIVIAGCPYKTLWRGNFAREAGTAVLGPGAGEKGEKGSYECCGGLHDEAKSAMRRGLVL